MVHQRRDMRNQPVQNQTCKESTQDTFHPHKLHQSGSEENHGKHEYELHHVVIVPPEEPTTYAWKQMQEGRLSKYGADVDDSVNYQVYQNIAPQQATSEAVRDTEGKILCQNGKPVQAYYFSTSSGVTSTDEIWGAEEPAPYLKSVDCGFDSEEPWSQWETEILWETLERRAQEIQGASGSFSVFLFPE